MHRLNLMSFDTALLTMADEIDELKAKVAKLEAEATAREPKLSGLDADGVTFRLVKRKQS